MRYLLLLLGSSMALWAACAHRPESSTSERPIRHEITSMGPRGCWGFDPYRRYPVPIRTSHPTFCLGEEVDEKPEGLYVIMEYEAAIVFSTTTMIPRQIEVGINEERRITHVRAGVRREEIRDYIREVSGLWGEPILSEHQTEKGNCTTYTWRRESLILSLDTCFWSSPFALEGLVDFRAASDAAPDSTVGGE